MSGLTVTMQLQTQDYNPISKIDARTLFKPGKNLFCAILLSVSQLHTVSAELPAPDGNDLLQACEYAQQFGYDNTKGMLCIWYVTPCDCDAGKQPAVPRVCLPAGISHEVLAEQVIAGLQNRLELQSLAEQAAAQVLAPLYPCSN